MSGWYADRMSEQIAVRIPNDLAESLDELVEGGAFASKAEAIRAALERLIDAERRRRVGALIAEGYRRLPQSPADELEPLTETAATATLRSVAAEEPETGQEW